GPARNPGSEVTPRDLRPGARGLERDVVLPEWARLLRFPDLLVCHRQVEVGVRKLRVRLDGAEEERDAELGLAALEHHVAEVVLRRGLARIDLERLSVELLGVLHVLTSEPDVAEVRVRDAEPRVELERLPIEVLGLVHGFGLLIELARLEVEL